MMAEVTTTPLLAPLPAPVMRLSRSLLKLIDEAILPAVLVFSAKLLGLVLVNAWLKLGWDAMPGQTIFPLFSYRSPEAFEIANGWSNALVLAVILVGFLMVLIRAHAFHSSHISPRLSVALVKLEMTGIAVSSWEIYHQAVIWLAYLWLALILFALQAVYAVSPWWIVILGGVIVGMFTWLFIVDVEREIELERERRHET